MDRRTRRIAWIACIALVVLAVALWLAARGWGESEENEEPLVLLPMEARDAGPEIDGGDPCASNGLPRLTTQPLVPDFEWSSPVFLTQPAGVNALFVVEQEGRIRVVVDGAARTFLDIRDRVEFGGERGLLGLAFHPDYANNRRFFVSYTPRGKNVVAEYRRSESNPLRADDAEVARLIDMRDPESNHNGGMITFGPDGFLYVGTGDGGGANDRHGRIGNGLSLETLHGKLLRLDVDNAPTYAARGNPFPDAPLIWAYGLRNPWRFSFDRATSDLYIADVGQNRWEEIDFTPAGSRGGENYGWRAYEGNEVFDRDLLDRVPAHAAPILVYGRGPDAIIEDGCSVTGGYVYRGRSIPGLRGYYLFGDWCSDTIAAFKVCDGALRGPTRVRDLGDRIELLASFGEDQDGELYMLGSDVVRIVAR